MYRVHQRVNLGIEWNPGENELGPLANLFLVLESGLRPAMSLGTSSDRIGTDAGTTSVFLTVAKRSPLPGLPVSAYASLNWSETDEAFNFPFGGTVHLGERFDLRGMYDGRRSHLLAGATFGRITVSALWIWLEHPGIAVSTGFGGEAP